MENERKRKYFVFDLNIENKKKSKQTSFML